MTQPTNKTPISRTCHHFKFTPTFGSKSVAGPMHYTKRGEEQMGMT